MLWNKALKPSSRSRYARVRAKWDQFLPRYQMKSTVWKNKANLRMDIKLALFIAQNTPCAPSHLTTVLSALRTSLANDGIRLPTLRSGELPLAAQLYKGFMKTYLKSPDKRGAALIHLWPAPPMNQLSLLEVATITVTFHCAARGASILSWELTHTSIIFTDGTHIQLANNNRKKWWFLLARGEYSKEIAGLMLKMPCKTLAIGSFYIPALHFLQNTKMAYLDPMWAARVLIRDMFTGGRLRRRRVLPRNISAIKISRALRKWGPPLKAQKLASHSLRSGWRTTATLLGLHEGMIRRIGRWSTQHVSEAYLRVPPYLLLQRLQEMWAKHFKTR